MEFEQRDLGFGRNMGYEMRWIPSPTLLQAGADPSIKGKKGSTPLHFAARRGNHEIVKVLLQRPKVKINAADSSGKTALHVACSEGHSSLFASFYWTMEQTSRWLRQITGRLSTTPFLMVIQMWQQRY